MSSHSWKLGPLVFEVVEVGSRDRGHGSSSRYLKLRCLTDGRLSGRLDLPSWIEREFKAGNKVSVRLQDRYPVKGVDNRGPFPWWLKADALEVDGKTLPLTLYKIRELLRKLGLN